MVTAGQDIVTGVPQKHNGTAQLPSCGVNNGGAMYRQHPNVAERMLTLASYTGQNLNS